MKLNLTMATNASGQACLQVAPSPSAVYRSCTSFTGTIADTWGSYTAMPEYNSILTTGTGSVRIVSFGAKIMAIVAPLSASGLVTMGTVGDPATEFDYAADQCVDVTRMPLHDTDTAWIAKPNDDYDNFQVYNYSLSTVGYPFTGLFVAVSGAPASTSVLQVEVYMNVEWIPLNETTFARFTTPAAAHKPKLESAIQQVQRQLPFVGPPPPEPLLERVARAGGSMLGAAYEENPLAMAQVTREFFGDLYRRYQHRDYANGQRAMIRDLD
jgi:hypothetical protein